MLCIRRTLGQGGDVNWIDRNDTRVSDIRKHARIIITKLSRLGKTREAAELVRRAIDENLINEENTYKIGTAFRFLDENNLIYALLEVLNYDAPIMLFIDNLPFNYSGGDLSKLSLLLREISKCKDAYVIAVARNDQISTEHRSWFETENFFEIKLSDLSLEQVGRLVDSASGLLKLQIDDAAGTSLLKAVKVPPNFPLCALPYYD